MNKRNGSLIALMLSAGLFYHPAAAPVSHAVSQAPQKFADQAKIKNNRHVKDGPWIPFCEHREVNPTPEKAGDSIQLTFDVSNGAKSAKGAFQASGAAMKEPGPIVRGEEWDRCKPDEPVKFIIASVPDPEQTHLALDFDRYVESIAWAVADSDYSLESYWFPWQPGTEKEETDPEKRVASRQEKQTRLEQPGTILFRKNVDSADKDELLAVLLVGERPTFGVNRVAFRAALDGIQRISPEAEKFYMVGPSFSGSLQPLSRLLNDSALVTVLPDKPFLIVSGQATSTSDLHRFREQFRAAQGSLFCTTVLDDQYVLHYFVRYLLELTESQETGHGGGLFHRLWGRATGRDAGTPEIAILSEDETAYGHNLEREPNILMVRYPRGIARLRNTTDEIPNIGSGNSSASRSQFPELPLILKETGEDVIRTFSQQQTPVSNESVLVNIAGMLRRLKVQYVGIVATDPLDALFLARFLRSACPDVQLVVFSSDLLFARVAHSWSLEGLLTVTTYPLILQNQAYMAPPRPRRIPFPSAYAQGLYNASRRVLLDMESAPGKPGAGCDVPPGPPGPDKDEMLDYSSPFPGLRESGHLVRNRRPSLWLTILGHESFWPMALLDGKPDAKVPASVLKGPRPSNERRGFQPERPALLWVILFALAALLSWTTVAAIAVMNSGRPAAWERRLRGFDFIRNLSVDPRAVYGASRAANLLIILITIAFVSSLFLIQSHYEHAQWLSASCAGLIAVSLAEGIWATWVLFHSPSRGWDSTALAVFSWLFGAVCELLLFSMLRNSGGLHTNDFLAYRTLHPESGVSPVVPILILAIGFFYWAFIQLRRLRWIAERQPTIPQDPCVCIETTKVHARSDPKPWIVEPPQFLQQETHSLFGARTGRIAVPLILFWLLVFWPVSHVKSAERTAYQVLFGFLLAVMYGMLIGNWVRFLVLWRDLAQFLYFLESHPIREAFSRLPRDFSWTSIWMGSLRPALITLTRSYDCLRTLHSNGIDLLSRPEFEALAKHLQKIADEQRSGEDRYGDSFFKAFTAIEESYGCAARSATLKLESRWQEGISDTVSAHEERIAPAALSDEVKNQWLLEEFLALRYVAFIRYVQQQMRNFLEFVTTAFILLAVATVAYPFQGHRAIATAHLLLFLIFGAGVVIVFARMDRDPLLSRLNNTKSNELGLDFLWRVVSYGSLPLLTLLGSQFPSIRDFLFSWVQPAIQAVK